MDQLLPVCTLTQNRTHNLGLCPDQDPNPQPFSAQDGAPANEATLARAVLAFYSFL